MSAIENLYEDTFDDYPDDRAGWSVIVLSERDYATDIARPQNLVGVGLTLGVNDEGGGSVTLDADDAFWDVPMPDSETDALVDQEAEWQLWYHGRCRGSFLAEDLTDDIVPEATSPRTITVSGRGLGAVLEWWKILPNGMPTPDSSDRKFSTAQPKMAAWLAMLNEAKDNGCLTFVVPQFGAVNDSNGDPWPDSGADAEKFTWTGGTNLLDQLKTICQQEQLEWSMHPGMKLDVRAAAGRHQEDTVLFTIAANQITHSRTRTRRGLGNAVIAWNGKKKTQTVTDSGSIGKWHKRFLWVEAGSADDDQGLTKIGNTALRLNKTQERSRTVKVMPDQPTRSVFLDYHLGDWIGVELLSAPPDSSSAVERVMGLTLQLDQDGNTDLELTLETRRQLWEQKVNDQLAGLNNGGTPGDVPLPPDLGGGGGGGVGSFVVVIHGDDGTVSRPAADCVYWVGAATPENAISYDFWFTATV